MKNYRVLKDWNRGEVEGQELIHVAGQIVNDVPDDVAEPLVADGTLEALGEEIPLSGEMVDFAVTQEFLDANPGTDLEIGQVIQIPKEAQSGSDEKIAESTPNETDASIGKVRTFAGKDVVSDGWREVGDQSYRHLKTADGAEFDLTDEEYEQYIQSNS